MIKGVNKLAFSVKLPNGATGNKPAIGTVQNSANINPAHTAAYQTSDFVVSTSQSAKLRANPSLVQPLNEPPRMD